MAPISANESSVDFANNPDQLAAHYINVRKVSEAICAVLVPDDYQIQSIPETSPPKWHLAHVTWFFETFLLKRFLPGYRAINAEYDFLFNSYYQTVGNMQPRAHRGNLSRPTVEEIYQYRAMVDKRILDLIDSANGSLFYEINFLITLGLHHEQQHQELLFMDIKHNFWCNPLKPSYLSRPPQSGTNAAPLGWETRTGGLVNIGAEANTFAFDNERPKHKVWLEPHRLANRLITNAEYLAFIEENGYRRPDLWLADGWQLIQSKGWQAPLYWEKHDGQWHEFSLYGLAGLNLAEPVAHVSYYEADAFARWTSKRLPTEAELETKLLELPRDGQFSDSGVYHPQVGAGQYYGTLWEWTASPYIGYPQFKPLAGSIGEYNGKFMCSQWVLKGGACVTSPGHIRPTYRNFFYPQDRWQFSGIRLAEDLC